MRKIKKTSLLLTSMLLFLSACQSHNEAIINNNKNKYYYSSIYFGKNLSKISKRGVRDGCTTSKGKYQKSHRLFRKSKEYEDAWFIGRNKCRHLLK